MAIQALSCLEVTTRHLDKTLGGQRELEKQVEDLKQQLRLSEKEKADLESKFSTKVKECRLQLERQECDRDKIKEMESKLANYRYYMHAHVPCTVKMCKVWCHFHSGLKS